MKKSQEKSFAEKIHEQYDERYGLPISIAGIQIVLCVGFDYAAKIMNRFVEAGLIVEDEQGRKYLNVLK